MKAKFVYEKQKQQVLPTILVGSIESFEWTLMQFGILSKILEAIGRLSIDHSHPLT
jgi:hypothetical protein